MISVKNNMVVLAKYRKKVLNRCQRIRIFDLSFISSDGKFSISWKTGGDFIILTKGNFDNPGIYIAYYLDHNDIDTRREQFFDLETSPGNLGGRRYWFTCDCGRRVAILYLRRECIACRHCHNLTYESQVMTKYRSWPAYLVHKILKIDSRRHRLQKQIKRKVYNKKPTKKVILYDQLLKRSMRLQGDEID